MQRTSLRSPLMLRLDVPLKKSTFRIQRPASRSASRACGRLHQRPHRRARLTAFLSSASATPGSARRAPHHFVQGYLVLAHLARTRPRVSGHHSRSPVPVATTYIRVVALQPCQSTGVLEMPSITAHHLLGAPPSPSVPANPTTALVASPRCRPHVGAIAASTRPSNPACSGLAQLRCARH